MKKIVLMLLIGLGLLYAEDYKVVFDCSSSDAHYIKSRMWLVGKTIDMIEKKGDKVDVALTLHGGCVPMVSEDYDMLVADEDVAEIEQAQRYLKSLSQRTNVKIIVCKMSLASNAIDPKDVLKFIEISPNSFLDTIAYQNRGYAIMTFK